MEAGEEFGGAQMLQAFEALEDPRSRKCTYPLQELLLVALSAVTSGADDWVSVADWAQLKLLWLRRFLPFDNGIASHDTFSRVFSLLDARCFEACFVAWMRSLCPSLDGHVVAIDGKSLRGSRDSGVNMAHLVAAYSSSAGVALGQVRTARKSNEITAIPALLDVLDVQGATITMDAMGCQREIVGQIADKGAHYVIGLKNNQPNLAQAVEALFDAADAASPAGPLQHDVTLDKGHGRIETRRCAVLHDLSAISEHVQAWPQLRSAVRVLSTREALNGRTRGSKPDTERRYYISSLALNAVEFNRLIRSHWSIENQFHWVLDVSFDEDACRVRVGDGAQNLAILRRIALNLLKQNKTVRASLNNKRLRAGWNIEYLQTVLGLTPR
jgi:predicted transposase YbfD/YdcC